MTESGPDIWDRNERVIVNCLVHKVEMFSEFLIIVTLISNLNSLYFQKVTTSTSNYVAVYKLLIYWQVLLS